MRKKLFAVIMSAMMMITFMPTMAFAAPVGPRATSVTWSSDYMSATATIYNGSENKGTVTATATADSVLRYWNASTGVITAVADFDGLTTSTGYNIPVDANIADQESFIDLAGAKIVSTNTTGTVVSEMDADLFMTYDNTYLETGLDKTVYNWNNHGCPVGNYLMLKVPADVEDQTAGTAKYIANSAYNGIMVVTVSRPSYEAYDTNESYPLTVKFLEEPGAGIHLVGTTSYTHDFKIKVYSVPTNQNLFKIGNESEFYGGRLHAKYDGTEQAVSLKVKGFTVEYMTLDKVTGTWGTWTTEAPKFKDAGIYDFRVRITRENDANMQVIRSLSVKMDDAECKFVVNTEGPYFESEKITKEDVVALVYRNGEGSESHNVNLPFAADKEAYKALLDKYVTVEGISNKAGKHDIKITFDKKGLLAAASSDALVRQFAYNYGLFDLDDTYVAYGKITVSDVAPYVVAANQTKTIHVKKAAKLKKKVTFKLKNDKTNDGTLRYYKKSTSKGSKYISVSKAGKVTLKKGLKKGTYTVKIYVQGRHASDMKKLKIKVVK